MGRPRTNRTSVSLELRPKGTSKNSISAETLPASPSAPPEFCRLSKPTGASSSALTSLCSEADKPSSVPSGPSNSPARAPSSTSCRWSSHCCRTIPMCRRWRFNQFPRQPARCFRDHSSSAPFKPASHFSNQTPTSALDSSASALVMATFSPCLDCQSERAPIASERLPPPIASISLKANLSRR